MIPILMIAMALDRPVPLVETVYKAAIMYSVDPVVACAMVEWESGYQIGMDKRCDDGSTDYGLMQLNSRYHPQYRESVDRHIVYGIGFFKSCLIAELFDVPRALARYHSGRADSVSGREYVEHVMAVVSEIEGWKEDMSE